MLERIQQVIENLVRTFNILKTYVDKEEPWLGILAAAVFAICSATNRLKGYIPVKLLFGLVIILPINIRWIGN